MAEISKIIAGDVTYHLRDRNYCTCSTGAGTQAKTANLDGFVLTTGSVVNVRFANSNTASNPTLNINDTGAHAIMKYGSTAPGVTAASSWYAGSIITLIYDGTYWVMVDFNVTGMYIASYGSSTYAEVLEAYQDNKIIYCRASSNTNPATGNQLRMAFLAYVNNQTTPTTFEFQYYRSVRNHSSTQQGDQVYVYQLNQSSGWSVTVRQSYTKIAGGTGLNGSYSNGVLTLNHSNSVTAQTTQAIYPIKIDAQGHINSYGSAITPLTTDSTLDATKLSGAVPRASLPSNYCTCNTVAGTAEKTASLTGFTLTTGAVVYVKFTYTNTASNPTLNINSTGAKSIKKYGTTAIGTTETASWMAGGIVTFVYDGANWLAVDFKQGGAENIKNGFGYSQSAYLYTNFLPYPYTETSKTQYGVTFTDNGDGTITVSGNASGGTPSFKFCENLYLDPDSYLMRWQTILPSNTFMEVETHNQGNYDFLQGVSGGTFGIEDEEDYIVHTQFYKGSGTSESFTLYPIICKSGYSFVPTYVPYGSWGVYVVLSDFELSNGGIVAIKFNDDVPAGTKIDINGTGLKPIWYQGTSIRKDIIQKNNTATFMYLNNKYYLLAVNKPTNASLGQGYGSSNNSITTGVNLLPYPYAETTKTVNGITFTDNGDGSITMNGTATGRAQFKFCESFDYSSGSVYDVAFLNENNELVNFYNYNATRLQINTTVGDGYSTDDFMSGFSQPISSVMVVTTGDTFNNFTFYPIITFYDSTHPQSFNWEPYTQSLIVSLPYYETTEGGIISVKMNTDVPAGCYLKVLYTEKGFPIKYKGSAITANVISNGDTATFMYSNEAYHLIALDSGGSYTPQTNASLGQGYGEVDSITRTGKNMLPYPYEDTTKTINGITFTDNGDGTITANGTVDSGYNAVFVLADSPLDVINPLEENVILSGCPEGGSSSTYCVYCSTQAIVSRDYGSGVNLGYQIDYAAIIIYSDTTVNNLTFSPMIRLSTESANWEAYNGPEVSVTLPSYELSEGGIVAIKTDDEITRGSLLNINDTGAKQIFNQLRPLKDNEICSGDTATFIYSNNIYYLLSVDRWQNLATPSSPGLMSASDKDKLDTVARNANNYYLPTASANVLGGVKVGTNLSISSGVLSATDTTYESKAAVNGGTDLSLVTTGEKFKWNMNDYCTCSTGASTADKTASLDGFVLDTGASVKVKFTNTNTAANPTLNINSTGAKPIMLYGTTPAGNRENNSWSAGSTVEFIYDGTNWVVQGGNVTNNAIFKKPVYIDAENGTDSVVGTSTLWVGNGAAEGTEGNSKGQVVIYGNGTNYVNVQATNATANRTVELPNENGTLMTNQGGTFTGHIYVDKPSSGTWQGYSSIVLGNDKAVGTDENSRGQVMIYGTGTNFATLNADPTADRTISLPDASGTIALDTAASQSAAGLMSAADKTKLDGIAAGANAYTLPVASSSAYGGIKVGNNLSITDGVLNYTLPMASASTLGGIKVGTNLSINASTGVLSATDTTYSAATQLRVRMLTHCRQHQPLRLAASKQEPTCLYRMECCLRPTQRIARLRSLQLD